MTHDTIDLLKTLCEMPGPVGREERVQHKVREFLKDYCEDLQQDKIGNLMATLRGNRGKYAFVAHADEVGFLVSNIDDKGFIRVKWNTTGYIPDLRLLPGQRVLVIAESGMVPGCFCVKTAHIAGAKGKKKIPEYSEVFLDIGASSADEVIDLGIHVGAPIIYATEVEAIGNHVYGKSMDDRIGLVMMILLAERLSKIPKESRPEVTFVSTVMEELGAKGAAAVAQKLDVDGVIIADIGLADDYPGTSGEAGVSLGKGPVIVVKDSQIHYSHELNKKLFKIAERATIPIQRAVYHNYATDGNPIASQGQRVSVVAVPCRYSHSSFEMINLQDLDLAISLVYEFMME